MERKGAMAAVNAICESGVRANNTGRRKLTRGGGREEQRDVVLLKIASAWVREELFSSLSLSLSLSLPFLCVTRKKLRDRDQ